MPLSAFATLTRGDYIYKVMNRAAFTPQRGSQTRIPAQSPVPSQLPSNVSHIFISYRAGTLADGIIEILYSAAPTYQDTIRIAAELGGNTTVVNVESVDGSTTRWRLTGIGAYTIGQLVGATALTISEPDHADSTETPMIASTDLGGGGGGGAPTISNQPGVLGGATLNPSAAARSGTDRAARGECHCARGLTACVTQAYRLPVTPTGTLTLTLTGGRFSTDESGGRAFIAITDPSNNVFGFR